ncbi:chaoptin-like [Argiope bruennichi]|uniref:chaoptin-like n=1 Tax=Argiope bruennichi TaxID=94029 RepID=UPI0024958239|nr:chaoptin-like [Argiope bruennichi]XP_055926248.1 chaoptin-like [Argiope bruennichi]
MICKCLPVFFLLIFLEAASSTYTASCSLLHVKYGSLKNYVICKGEFLPVENLKKTLQNFTESINTFELRNVSMDVLPGDMFGGIKKGDIQKIIFSHSTVELLNLPEMQYSAFKSVEDTLESFEVYDSSSVFAWNISILASLKKLEKIVIENSEFFEVKAIFGNFPRLRLIQFINSAVRWVHPEAFKNIKKLTICSLANNYITEVKRSMFPQPATYLWNLDLSFNRLKSLPKDMFDDMPSLHELKLDNNHLRYFKVELVKPMWNQLTQLWLDGNNALCWPFCWIIEKEHRPLFLDSAKCRTSKSIRLDEFYSRCKKF